MGGSSSSDGGATVIAKSSAGQAQWVLMAPVSAGDMSAESSGTVGTEVGSPITVKAYLGEVTEGGVASSAGASGSSMRTMAAATEWDAARVAIRSSGVRQRRGVSPASPGTRAISSCNAPKASAKERGLRPSGYWWSEASPFRAGGRRWPGWSPQDSVVG